MSGSRTGLLEVCTRERRQTADTNDLRIRYRRSGKVSEEHHIGMIYEPSSRQDRQRCFEACRRNRSLEIVNKNFEDLDTKLTNNFLNKTKPRLNAVIILLDRREEQRDYHSITQNLGDSSRRHSTITAKVEQATLDEKGKSHPERSHCTLETSKFCWR